MLSSPRSNRGELRAGLQALPMKASAMLQTTQEAIPTNHTPGENARTARIRALNDQFRTGTMGDTQHLGRRLVTRGIWDLGAVACFDIMCKVRTFDTFDEDNDPWGEHDFGAFDYKGDKIFWKIDYYDKAQHMGSPDPADPDVTCRVLTVMLASEY